MSQLKQILNDGLLYAISKLIPGLVGILFILIFTRILGLNNYGKYSLYIAQFNLLVSLVYGVPEDTAKPLRKPPLHHINCVSSKVEGLPE